MKQGSNQRRSRGRNNNGGRRPNRNHTYESNGPDVKVRGTAQQVLDKYLQLARDSQSGGDRVKAEAYLQFAEHYYRIVNLDQDQDQNKGDKNAAEQSDAQATQPEQSSERQERKPRGRRPRQQPQKNEATLAAEAAAANEEAQKASSQADEAEVEVLNVVEDAQEPADEAEAVGA